MRSHKTSGTTKRAVSTQSRGGSVNQVTLIGRLMAAPEPRRTASGKSIATVRIATNDREQPEFHDVVRWRQHAVSSRST